MSAYMIDVSLPSPEFWHQCNKVAGHLAGPQEEEGGKTINF